MRRKRPQVDADGSGGFPALAISIPHVEERDIETLIPYARNARIHDEKHVAQLAASIREWGWTMPILIDESGGIIAGHGRILAARKLGLKRVPVLMAIGWSEAKKRAYILADNKLALNAKWNDELLGAELADLKPVFDVSLVGFSSAELLRLTDWTADEQDASAKLNGLCYHVIVDCANDAAQAALLERLQGEGLTCRALIP